jgi:hypothetical protein
MLLVFVLLSSSVSYNKSLASPAKQPLGKGAPLPKGNVSQNISDDSHSTQGKPSGSPEDPKSNKPNKSSELDNSNSLAKSPVYPHTPVKVYNDASVSKFDIYKDFKDVSIIYMWFNKITGRVYIGSGVNGSRRLSTYFQPSILKKNSLIYQSILKYGHKNFSVIILEICGKTSTVTKDHILSREKFYLDWALKTYGLAILNLLNMPGSSLGYKHTEENLLKMSELKKGKMNPMFNKIKSFPTPPFPPSGGVGGKGGGPLPSPLRGVWGTAFIAQQIRDKSGENNPMFGKTKSEQTLAKLRKMIFVYDVTQDYKLLGVYPTVMCTRLFKLCNNTLRKRINNKEIHNGKYFFSKDPYNSDEV